MKVGPSHPPSLTYHVVIPTAAWCFTFIHHRRLLAGGKLWKNRMNGPCKWPATWEKHGRNVPCSGGKSESCRYRTHAIPLCDVCLVPPRTCAEQEREADVAKLQESLSSTRSEASLLQHQLQEAMTERSALARVRLGSGVVALGGVRSSPSLLVSLSQPASSHRTILALQHCTRSFAPHK